MNYSVKHETCIKCKMCIEVCPVNLIHIDNDNLVNFIGEREIICLECGQCMAVCSTESITIPKYSYERDFHPLPESNINLRQYSDFLSSRRSIRNFKKKKVTNEIIESILETIVYAPYGAEPEKTEITVVNNREKITSALPFMESFLDDIGSWLDNPFMRQMIKFKTTPETFSTLKNHLYPMIKLDNYKLKYGDRITRNAPAIILFHAKKDAEEHTNNALIYATYAMLAAHAFGLGAAMNGIIPAAVNKVKEVREIFQIPNENEVVISLILGYPKFRYQRTVKRNKITTKFIN